MKKMNLLGCILLGLALILAACGADAPTTANVAPGATTTDIEPINAGAIAVISREEGSGARSVFEEVVGVNTDKANMMTASAIIQNGNGVVADFVTRNKAAMGYISFATFTARSNELVGLYVDGMAPTTENMLSGGYKLVRPFNFVYLPGNVGIIEEAFIAFAASMDGLELLADMGAVVDMADAVYFDMAKWDLPAGTVSFGGSTSTEATASRLMEEFMAMFPQVEITYESVGSGAGITGVQAGTFSLGFASRAIKDSELETGLRVIQYCVDGIVVVVNPASGVTRLSIEEIRNIFLGKITDWSQIEL